MNFGEKLKQIRTERNMTQPQFAQAIGIEQSYLSKLENEKSIPSADMFQSIIQALDIDAKVFLQDIDKQVLQSSLRQIPEVANFLAQHKQESYHNTQKFLFSAAGLCVIGLTLIVAGWMGWIFSNQQFVYRSEGVIKPGENIYVFEKAASFLYENHVSREFPLNDPKVVIKQEQQDRRHPLFLRFDYPQNNQFEQKVEGGVRFYNILQTEIIKRLENNMLMLFGTLLSFAGLFGFILEMRLRKK